MMSLQKIEKVYSITRKVAEKFIHFRGISQRIYHPYHIFNADAMPKIMLSLLMSPKRLRLEHSTLLRIRITSFALLKNKKTTKFSKKTSLLNKQGQRVKWLFWKMNCQNMFWS